MKLAIRYKEISEKIQVVIFEWVQLEFRSSPINKKNAENVEISVWLVLLVYSYEENEILLVDF